MERYDVIKTIGKGAGGKVLLATEKNSSRYSWVNLAEQTGTILFITTCLDTRQPGSVFKKLDTRQSEILTNFLEIARLIPLRT